jgi:hypothetical protein
MVFVRQEYDDAAVCWRCEASLLGEFVGWIIILYKRMRGEMSNGVLPSVYIYRAGKDGLKRRHQFHILADLTPLAATEKSNLSFKQNTNRVNVFNRARSGSGRAVPQLRQPISHPILDPTEPSRESTHTHVTMPPERYRQACPCTVASPCPCTLHAGARWFAFIGEMWRSVRRDGRLREEFFTTLFSALFY